MVSIPSVAMKGCTLPRVMTRPLTSPSSAPTASPPPMPTSTGRPAASNPAITAPENASTEPTLRSMPPVRITNVMPAAMTALMETCRAMLSRLLTVRNDPLSTERTTRSSAKAMAMPKRRSTFRRRASGSLRSVARPYRRLNCTPHPPGRRRHDPLLGRLRARELRGDHSFVHHQDAIGHSKDLFHLRGDHHNPHPSPSQRDHQMIDLDLRADVDAARRLDHEQHPCAGLQPFGHHDLLLRPAAEVAHDLFGRGHRHIEIADGLGDERGLVQPPDEERHRQPPDDRQRDVRAHAHGQHETQPLPILRTQTYSLSDARCRGADAHRT